MKQKNNFEERRARSKRSRICLDLVNETVLIYMEEKGGRCMEFEKGEGGGGFDLRVLLVKK